MRELPGDPKKFGGQVEEEVFRVLSSQDFGDFWREKSLEEDLPERIECDPQVSDFTLKIGRS
jgi:hypothetical protein